MQTLGPFKVVILGEGRVGKTSLLKRYKYNQFDEHEASSQNATYLEKTVEDKKSGKEVKLALWDTAGQERFHSLAPIYYRDADGALIVYDITEPESFKRVATWANELKANGCSIPVSLVGNKYDMKTQQRVPQSEAEDFAKRIGARHSYASAKHSRGVDETFAMLIEGVVDHKSQAPAASARGRRSRPMISEVAPTPPPGPRVSLGGGGQQAAAQPAQPAQAAPRTSVGEQQPKPKPKSLFDDDAAPISSVGEQEAKPKPKKSLFDDDDDDVKPSGPAPGRSNAYDTPAPVAPAATVPPLPAPAAPREQGFKLTPQAPRGQVAAGASFSSGQSHPERFAANRKKEGCC